MQLPNVGSNPPLHDWTLVSIKMNWEESEVYIEITGTSRRSIKCIDVQYVDIPKKNDWGPSVYINGCEELSVEGSESKRLSIEMQSGDTINIVAGEFCLE